ncbi:hypothetical protein KFE25_011548 [Diacronema lutheri]|uniref:tRNA-binding domain-containing protein n=1 Tax=Diacronema lutheri TaxID=2081491 RepID=A0A8J6CC28_DIALT|nr:hypothetical protein KFE25_011548 [Diacronema lutheri]
MSRVVGLVRECEPVAGKDKLKRLSVDVGGAAPVQLVTNAPNVEAGKRIVVALVGAEVGGVAVRRATVGGVPSEGMVCDATMLGWTGGGAGLAALVPASYAPGDAAPPTRPRLDERPPGAGAGAASEPPPGAGREVEPLFAKKPSRDDKKAAAAARKAERDAKKAAAGGGGDGASEPAGEGGARAEGGGEGEADGAVGEGGQGKGAE